MASTLSFRCLCDQPPVQHRKATVMFFPNPKNSNEEAYSTFDYTLLNPFRKQNIEGRFLMRRLPIIWMDSPDPTTPATRHCQMLESLDPPEGNAAHAQIAEGPNTIAMAGKGGYHNCVIVVLVSGDSMVVSLCRVSES